MPKTVKKQLFSGAVIHAGLEYDEYIHHGVILQLLGFLFWCKIIFLF